MISSSLKWCSNCLAMSTRNRISFDERGFCNACRWMEKKKSLDWKARQNDLNNLLNDHRSNKREFDCLVPCSGGKDGSYVAYNLKHKYNMNPLCLTVTPPLSLPLGDENLKSFIDSGYSHISINPENETMRLLNKLGFEKMGFPYYGWLIAIQSAPITMAIKMGIDLIFYGEDGEIEYGGSEETNKNPIFNIEYMKRIYLEGGYEKVFNSKELKNKDLNFFKFPEISKSAEKIKLTHWSYFENWDPYRNYLVAKEHCGLKESDETNSGTFTNFSQNDQALYSLHTYLMYLKYGFGRANQDASIEIRRGAMSRSQAVNLVNLYDGQFPDEHMDTFLNYYKMSQDEFDAVLDKWANKEIFEKIEGFWRPKFKVA